MNKVLKKAFELLIILVSLSGLILTLIGSVKTGSFIIVLEEIFRLLFYFTIDSSLFVLILFTVKALSREKACKLTKNPVLLGAVTMNILVTGIVFLLMLRSFEAGFGPALYAGNICLHYLLPPLCLLYFLVYTSRAKLKYSHILYWIIFPTVYFIITIIRGAMISKYPYPFIDANTLGYPKVFITSLILLGFIMILGAILVLINNLINTLIK